MRHAAISFSGTFLVSFSAWAGPAEDDFASRCADPDVVRLLPPLILEDDHVSILAQALERI